jgi:DNA repair exonuclease SbcCD ATPase subunit
MQLNASTPIFKQCSNPYDAKQDPAFAKAYGYIVTIMQTKKTDKEKIELIMKVFDEVIEASVLQEQCIEELEKENNMLSEANDKFIAKHEELTKKIRDLANQIDLLAKRNGLVSKENDQIRHDLEQIIKEKQVLLDRQDLLEKENVLLAKKVKDLLDEKNELIDKQQQFVGQLSALEKEAKVLLEESEVHLIEQKKIKEELGHIQVKNKQLDAELEELEIQKRKEWQFNCLDELGYVATGIWFTTGVIASGGMALPGLLAGGAVYGFYQSGKQYIKHSIEEDLKEYAKKHPTASKKEVWEQVMRMRSKQSN